MFVADALDAVGAEAVVEQGGALQGFAGGNFAGWELLFHIIATADCTGGSSRQDDTTVIVIRAHDGI